MDRTFLAVSLASVVLLVGGVAAGVFLGGTGVFDQRPRVDPAVTSFSAEDPVCVADPNTTVRVSVGNNTRGSFLTIRTNVTVATAGTGIDGATLTETGLANYSLAYEAAGRGDPCARGERAVVFTQTTVGVPHPGGEPYGITARLENRTLFRVRNTPDGLRVREEA